MDIFGHLNSKIRFSAYPIRRVILLVEAVSRDLNDQLIFVLRRFGCTSLGSTCTPVQLLTSTPTLIQTPTPYENFDRTLSQMTNVFRTWEEGMSTMTLSSKGMTSVVVSFFFSWQY